MSEAQHTLVILFIVYIVTSVSLGLITGLIWLNQRDPLLRKLTLACFFAALSTALQVILPQEPLLNSVAVLFSLPSYALFCRLLGDLSGNQISRRLVLAGLGLGLAGSIVGSALKLPFWAISLPSCLALAYPALYAGFMGLRPRDSLSFEIRTLSVVMVLAGSHVLDYPFLRQNLGFAPYGFGISIVFLFWIAVLAPYAILRKTRDAVILAETTARLSAEHAMDEFVSLASHEFKTPVTSMLLRLSMVKRELDRHTEANPISPERIRRLTEQSMRQTEQLGRLVDNLLSVPRMRAGMIAVKRERVELGRLTIETIERFADPRLILECTDILEGHWDRTGLEQVLTNIFGNALKYGLDKPVVIRVKRNANQAVLEVEDQGIGIEPEVIARIFEPYRRAPSASGFGGMGLGLYIVKQIVESLSGVVSVQNRSDGVKGCLFTVCLPLMASADAP